MRLKKQIQELIFLWRDKWRPWRREEPLTPAAWEWINSLMFMVTDNVWGIRTNHHPPWTYRPEFIVFVVHAVAQLCPTLCDPKDCSTSGFPVLHYVLEFVQFHVCWVSDAIQPSYPLSPFSPALNLSQHQGLSQWVSCSHKVAKVLENFSSSISPSNEHSGWFSFRIDWFELLAVQGTLRSLLQHHDLKASILQHSAFFMVQSHSLRRIYLKIQQLELRGNTFSS